MKKNGHLVSPDTSRLIIKCLLTMKFTILFVLILSLQSFAKGYGQDNITLNLEGANLKKAFKAIEDQGVFRFVYKDEILPREFRVSIHVENRPLEEVLGKILTNTTLTYRRLGSNLVVITNQQPGKSASHLTSEATVVISGRITDEKGDPLGGVSVQEKGTTNGTIAKEDGLFVLNASSADATLIVSYIGFQTQEVKLEGRNSVNIQMVATNRSISEVIVVGYGQQRRSLSTGAISSVKSEQLATVSSTRIDQALQGRTAGVLVLPTSGQPGAGLNIRIRGAGSNRNSNPLYIIDGVRAGGIEYLDPSEVASIEILKDAASAAIYGAEGANGVIIITTKTGKRNSAEVSYSGQYSWQSLKDDFIQMMNAQQYQQYLAEAGVSGAPTPADIAGIGEGTNWLKQVVNVAPQQHHSLQFSGGSDRSSYLVGGSIFTQEGIVGGEKARFNRYTVRFNGDHKVKNWLTIGNRVSYTQHRRRAISDNNEFGSILSSALVMDPITPVVYTGTLPPHVQNALVSFTPGGDPISELLTRDPNGNLYGISNFLKGEYGNPISRIGLAKGENVQNKIVGNVYAEIAPFNGFVFTSRFGVDAAFQTGHGWTPTFWYSSESLNTIANGYDYSNNWYTWQWENFATYKRSFGDHNFTLLGGVSAIKTKEYHIGGSYSGLFKEDDRFSYADYVPNTLDLIGSNGFTYTLASYFGRLSYTYKDRYLLNASVRRDGSSKLAPGHQWKTYPAISAGWILSNESFFDNVLAGKLSYLKLRGSWGQNGNVSSVGIGEWMNAIGSGFEYRDGNGNVIVGAAPTSLANPDLTWETSEQFDIGADLAFFNNRLSLTVDYYKKTTKDLLTGGTPPDYVGNILRTVNAGNVVNKGWEFEISYNNRTTAGKNSLTYDISANLSTLDNEVTYLDPNSPVIFGAGIGTGWSATAMKVGYPVWYFNGYKTDGIFQNQAEITEYLNKTGITGYSPKPGEPIVVDVNGDKQISPGDMTYIGSPHPSITFGGRLSLGYKGFDLLVFVQGQSGNDILMGFNRTDRATANKPYFFYANRWTGEGSTNSWFAANTFNPYIYNSDLMIFNGAYTRIRQLQLGYTLPLNMMKKINIRNARVYVSLDDFFTFTKYPGVDPEGGSNGQNSIGIDRGGYPVPRKAIVGLTFNF